MTFDNVSWLHEAAALRQALLAAEPDGFGQWDGEHVAYSDLSDRFWALLKAAQITVVPADYIAWKRTSDANPDDVDWYHSASLEAVAMAATYLERRERHNTGSWRTAFEDGVIPELIARLEVLHDELPFDPASSQWTNRYSL